MKNFLLLAAMLIASSALVQGMPSRVVPKISFPEKTEIKKSLPDNVLVININQLREETKDISLLKPVFMIVSALENATEKLHGRKLKITCNKSADKRD